MRSLTNIISFRSSLASAAAALILTTAAVCWALPAPAAEPAAQPPKGEAEFRAAWVAFSAPARVSASLRSLDARQQAQFDAIPHLEQAVSASPKHLPYQVALCHVLLSAGQYQKALAAVEAALKLDRNDPLLHLLRGQAKACLAQADPEKVQETIPSALTEFRRAAELDPDNALPLLQAASVAFDAERPDLALPLLDQALARKGARFYRLPVPGDLLPDRGESLRAWQYVQLGQWMEFIARCQNAASYCLKLGAPAAAADDLPAARKYFWQTLQIAGRLGAAEPHMFIAVSKAIDLLQDSYEGLSRVEARRLIGAQFSASGVSPESQPQYYLLWGRLQPAPSDLTDPRWTADSLAEFFAWLSAQAGDAAVPKGSHFDLWMNERGIAEIGRQQLLGQLQAYTKEITEKPPLSVEELLEVEASRLKGVIAGIGLPLADSSPLPPRHQ